MDIERLNVLLPELVKNLHSPETYPVFIEFHPTNYCNLRCGFCVKRGREEMEGHFDLINEKRIFDLARESIEIGTRLWIISGGGEPLLRTDLTLNLMEYIKKAGLLGWLNTNGYFISDKTVASRIISMEWDCLQISIHGVSKRISSRLCANPYAFEKAFSGIELLNYYSQKLKKRRPKIEIIFVINKYNFMELPKVFEKARDLKVDCVFIKSLDVACNTYGKFMILKEFDLLEEVFYKAFEIEQSSTFDSNLDSYINITKKHDKFRPKMPTTPELQNLYLKGTGLSFLKNRIEEKEYNFIKIPCLMPWYYMIIQADGSAGYCCYFNENMVNVKENSIMEVFNSNYFMNIRKILGSGGFPEDCKRCNAARAWEAIDLKYRLIEYIKTGGNHE